MAMKAQAKVGVKLTATLEVNKVSSDTQLQNLIFIDSDNLFGIDELTNQDTGLPVGTAVIVGQVFDDEDVQIGNDVTLAVTNAQKGQYLGTFPAAEAALLLANGLYTVLITATDAVGILVIKRGVMATIHDGVVNG